MKSRLQFIFMILFAIISVFLFTANSVYAKKTDKTDKPNPEELAQAIENKDLALAKKLLKSGVDPNANPYGIPFLWSAIEDIDLVKLLLKNGANPNAVMNLPGVGVPVLFLAIGKGNLSVIKALIAHGADVNIKNSKGKSALDYAKDLNKPDVVSLLIKAGGR